MMVATLGSRRRRQSLLYWFALRRLGQWCWDHKRGVGITLVLLVALGILQRLTLLLGLVHVLGWGLLGWERRDRKGWRPAKGARPWHRPLKLFWRGFLDKRRCYLIASLGGLWWWMPWAIELLTPINGRLGTALLGVLSVKTLIRLRVPPNREDHWFQEGYLLRMWTAVGVVPKPVPGGPKKMLSRQGQHWDDDEGEHVRFRSVDDGIPWTAFAAKATEVASFLDLPRERIRIRHAGGGEGRVQMSVLHEREKPTLGGLSWLCTAERTSAYDPVRIGGDEDSGAAVELENYEANDLFAGIMGSGKSECVRMPLGAFLLDPTALIFGLDGKGSRKDYSKVAPLCEQWIWGFQHDADERLVVMLRKLYALAKHRNSIDDGRVRFRPVLVLLEELQDVLTGSQYESEICDLIGQIERIGRAVFVKTIIVTQRTSVEDIPAKIRNLLSQRVALQTMNPADYALVLNVTAAKLGVRLPKKKRGQGIVRRPDGLFALVPDRMPLEEWEALCERAARLRDKEKPDPTELHVLAAMAEVQAKASLAAVTPPAAPVDELIARTHEVLTARGPLQASALKKELGALWPGTDRDLGVRLRDYPQHVERRRYKGNWCWWPLTLAPTVAEQAGAPSHEGVQGPDAASQGDGEGLALAGGRLP